jgi:hypothetical protein
LGPTVWKYVASPAEKEFIHKSTVSALKEVVLAKICGLSGHLPEGAEKYHETIRIVSLQT